MGKEIEELTDSIRQAITMGKDLEGIKKELNEARTEKANLVKDLNLIKKEIDELREVYTKDKKKKEDEIARLKKVGADLETKNSSISSNSLAEYARLSSLQSALSSKETELNQSETNLERASKNLSDRERKFASKIEIVAKISELANKL